MGYKIRLAATAAVLAFGASAANADCGGTYCSSDMSKYEGAGHHAGSHSSQMPGSVYSGVGGGVYESSSTYSTSSSYGTSAPSPVAYGSSTMGGGVYGSSSDHASSYGSSSYSSDSYGSGSYGSGAYDMGTTTVVGSGYSSSGVGISEAYTLQGDSGHSGSMNGTGGGSNMATSWSTSGMVSGASLAGLGASENLCPVACGSPAEGGSGKVLGCYTVCKPAPVPVTTTTYTQVVHPVIHVRYPVPYAVPVQRPYLTKYSRYGGGYNAGYGHAHGYGSGHYGYGQGAYGHGAYGHGYGTCAAKTAPHHGRFCR